MWIIRDELFNPRSRNGGRQTAGLDQAKGRIGANQIGVAARKNGLTRWNTDPRQAGANRVTDRASARTGSRSRERADGS